MVKAETKNYLSMSQGIKELEGNDSMSAISSCADSFLKSLQDYRDALETSDMDTSRQLDQTFEESIKKYQDETLQYEKSLNKSIKSLSSKVDKSINWELDMVYPYQIINDEFDLIIRAIVSDLLYQGKFEEAGLLVQNDQDFDLLLDHFKQLREMIKSIYDEDYSIVYNWVIENEDRITHFTEIKSSIIRLIYYQILQFRAKETKLPPHGNVLLDIQNTKDTRILMRIKDKTKNLEHDSGNILYTFSLPELDDFDKTQVKDNVVSELIRLYNKLSSKFNRLQQESPMYKCLLAGHFALSAMVKYNTISRRKSSSGGTSALSGGLSSDINTGISDGRRRSSRSISDVHPLVTRMRGLHTHANDTATEVDGESYINKYNSISSSCVVESENKISELPMEIELPSWMGYHSIFICPILKEETTITNKPYVLPCRHFISEQALSKLAKGLGDDIKCPYCPRRSSWRDASEVKFVAI